MSRVSPIRTRASDLVYDFAQLQDWDGVLNVGFRVYGNPLATLPTHFPIAWTVKGSVVGTKVLAVLVICAGH